MNNEHRNKLRSEVRRRYGNIAKSSGSCGCGPDCCGTKQKDARGSSLQLGYTGGELDSAPEGSNMGLGCGNPQAIAALRDGEVVLDLGCGGGFDCFLAAAKVGERGMVIGVDMTPEMVETARKNAAEGGYGNVDFRLGEIENIPSADNTADVIISNCVINLSPDKPRVFAEAFRVLKPGGRLAISDVVALGPLSEDVRNDLSLYTGCISGASPVGEIEAMLRECGFTGIRITVRTEMAPVVDSWATGITVSKHVAPASIEAVKPAV